jgi:glyoxylase-like metal-dependent hydrolase (beta-lactamase superfamily II)
LIEATAAARAVDGRLYLVGSALRDEESIPVTAGSVDVAATQSWRIGAVSVTRVEEQIGFASFPPEQFFVGFERALVQRHLSWLVPNHYSPEQDRLVTSVHSWLVRTARHTILIDCCGGNHKERPDFRRFHQLDTPYLARLRAAGAAPEDIDIVLCTHLHADHVGWNTMLHDGRWVPTFPNAKYLFSRTENDVGNPDRNPAADADPQRGRAYRDSVLPVIEAGQAVLIDGAHAIDDAVLIEPAPGHTPGHVVLKLADRGERALFCGDALHHPLQVYAPHWNSRFCELPQQARATRRRMLEHCAGQRALLFPIHFGAPHVAEILGDGDAFSLRFVPGKHGDGHAT